MTVPEKIAMIYPLSSQYDSLQYFTRKLGDALERLGREVSYFDPSSLGSANALRASLRGFSPDLLLSFNSLMEDSEGLLLCERMNLPHLVYMVDPPHQFLPFRSHPLIYLASVDRESSLFFKEQLGHSPSMFLPHAIENEILMSDPKEKKYPLTVCATCVDYESLRERWRSQYPAEISSLLDDMIDSLDADRELGFLDTLQHFCRERGFLEDLGDLNNTFVASMWYLADLTIRGRDRVRLLKSFKHLDLHVFGQAMGGSGWEKYLGSDANNIHIHPPLSFSSALKLMEESQVCLSSFPIFRSGVHERVLSGMACGALVLADDSPFMREHFIDDTELLIYDPQKLADIEERVLKVLEEPNRVQEVVSSARQKLRTHFTWDVRADQLLRQVTTAKT